MPPRERYRPTRGVPEIQRISDRPMPRPSTRQLYALAVLGVTVPPETKADASVLIERLQGERARRR